MLNRTPESFKTDVAPQWPGDSSSFAKSGRRLADLLQAWDRFVRSAFSHFTRHNRTAEMFEGDVAPQRFDETALLFAKAGLRRSIDLLQAWHRFVVATFSHLSQRASEMLQAAAAPEHPDDSPSLAKSGRRQLAQLLLQGRRNFKSTTLGTVWRAGSTA